MKRNIRSCCLVSFLCINLLFCFTSLLVGSVLDDYLAAYDDSYSYREIDRIISADYTGYILEMKSQRWRSEAEVDRSVWEHWLTIVVPSDLSGDTAILVIDGGGNGGPVPTAVPQKAVFAALESQSVVVNLLTVPNQPLKFADEMQSREEDVIIAYSFDKYLTTGDANWPLLLPMVKSAVRAMDTVQEYLGGLAAPVVVNKFFVMGASKRGWTTWLTAAADSRVVGIAPIVIDVLNMEVQLRHHYGVYGFYSSVVHDYVDMDIFSRLHTAEGQALLKIVDPYEYRSRLTMPKYLINATGDQFFPVASSQFYFDSLPGVKYLRYVPNVGHDIGKADINLSLIEFYKAVSKGEKLPRFSWIIESDGTIKVKTVDKPYQVNLWQATNMRGRDFRFEILKSLGVKWVCSALSEQGKGNYIAQVPEPSSGVRAFFVELVYESGGSNNYIFTTGISVVPNYFPYIFDFDTDGEVDFSDLTTLAQQWLEAD